MCFEGFIAHVSGSVRRSCVLEALLHWCCVLSEFLCFEGIIAHGLDAVRRPCVLKNLMHMFWVLYGVHVF